MANASNDTVIIKQRTNSYSDVICHSALKNNFDYKLFKSGVFLLENYKLGEGVFNSKADDSIWMFDMRTCIGSLGGHWRLWNNWVTDCPARRHVQYWVIACRLLGHWQ